MTYERMGRTLAPYVLLESRETHNKQLRQLVYQS